MSDDATTIREALNYVEASEPVRYSRGIAALDRLEAERDAAKRLADMQATELGHERRTISKWMLRAEAAEAELAIEREANPNRVVCPKCQANLPCESCKRYSVLRDDLEAERDRLRAYALLAKSEIDWCIGYAKAFNAGEGERLLIGRLVIARAALAEGDTP
jgi:hypothetical protein